MRTSYNNQNYTSQVNAFPVSSLRGLGFTQLALPLVAGSGPAAPFVAAALIVAPYLIKIFAKMAKGCGQSCVLTSDAANDVERLLQKNLAMYEASGHTKAEQQAALDYFDLVWGQLVEFCGKPEFQGTKAGRNCVDDRRDGACKWRGADGQCWNWFKGYREPIENDPNVKANPHVESVSGAVDEVGQSLLTAFQGKDSTVLLLLAAAVAVVYVAS